MLIFETVSALQNYLTKNNFLSIGFVPTMGALHQGHLSLIEKAQHENELTVCSIFVNPTQFNKQEDLIKYPRNVPNDVVLLKSVITKNVVLFLPSVQEIYPKKSNKKYYFNSLSEVMEAQHRPGHFDGVAMVIERFLEIINPTNAYFGEKDFQQLAVVRALVNQLNSAVKIVGCPIVRAQSGLAMSSRNERLSESQKELATKIFEVLCFAKQHAKKMSIKNIKQHIIKTLAATNSITLEYFELADGNTLKSIINWEDSSYCVAFIAVHIGGVRLIDNMTLFNDF